MKKWCFVAKEVKGGWRLKLAYGSKDYPVRGIVFKKMEEVEQLTHDGKVVFVHLKNSKYPVFGSFRLQRFWNNGAEYLKV